MNFTYQHKGSANDDWNTDVIEANSLQDAKDKLDEIYGIKRDEGGKQTNADMIQVEVLSSEGIGQQNLGK